MAFDLSSLAQFTGSETLMRHQFFKQILMTEGVQALAKGAGAWWFVDMICGAQFRSKNKLDDVPFQVWKLNVEDKKASITVTDGNDNLISRCNISFTDFPEPGITLWLVNRTLMLPSEY